MRKLVVTDAGFELQVGNKDVRADFVPIATVSAREPLRWVSVLGHSIVPQVPTLFSFQVRSPLLEGLAGFAQVCGCWVL